MNSLNRRLVPLFSTILWLAGCAAYRHDLVLEPVGPKPAQPTSGGSQGTLIVFSAFGTESTLDPEHATHSRYKIFTDDGKLLQTVRNDTGTALEGPAAVGLAPGSYRVVARANGYGLVTVPVVVAANQTTTVHLEGGGSAPDQAALTFTNVVHLPDGQRVGWRATPVKP